MRILLFILASFFCGYQSIAQLSKTSFPFAKSIYSIKGDYYRQYRNYVLAINTYSRAIKQNPKEVSAILGMADAYHMLGLDDLSCQWYRKAFAIDPDAGAEHILKYIAILSTSGNPELRHQVTLYNMKVTKSGEPMDSAIFVTENLTSLNSKGSDSAPVLYDNKMIFSSDRASAGNFNSYKSELNSEGIFGEVSSLHGEINPGRTEGGFAIAPNAATLFFTRTEMKSATTPPAMELFSSAIPAGPSEQLKIRKLTFKNFDHSIAHPAVNSEGTELYFAAHSPKDIQGFDLYHSQYNGKKWSAPVALGASVNSLGDELYPVLVNDSILYFASNGHGGLGGFDIFKVNLRDTDHHQPEHLPAPVNSPADEFGFIMNSTGNEGYLSSNRPGGLGGNDIYRIYILPFKKKKNTVPKQEELFIYTSKGDEIKLSGSSKENLKFDFQPGRTYKLVVEYDNFRAGTAQTIKNAATLTRMSVYTFDIQKSSETVYDQKNKSKPVQDIHINPGDLVTFQLIPNLSQDFDADVGKIQFQKSEAFVGDRESIVFSYVAEGGSGIPEGDILPIADLSKLDTVSGPQPLATKAPPAKSGKVAPTPSAYTTATTPALQQVAAAEPAKTQVADLNRPAPVEALTSTVASEKNVADANKPANPAAEKSGPQAPSTLLPAEVVALPTESAFAKDNDAGPVAVTGNALEAQQQNQPESAQVQGDNKVSTPAGGNDVVVAAKTDEKNPALAKNANEVTLNKSSVITKKNVEAKVAEASQTDKVALAEVATTQALPDQNNAAQATTLVPGNPIPVGNTTDIQYRVQIAASKSTLSDNQLKKVYPGAREIRSFSEDGYHKYYIEETPNYRAAKRTMNESGVEQAFIAAYQGDKKLKLQEAIALQKNMSSITEPQITDSATEPHGIVNTQANNSTEALAGNIVPVATEGNNEKPLLVATRTSQEAPGNVPTPEVKAQNTTPEKKPPVGNAETNEPAGLINAQPNNSMEVLAENIVPVTTEGNNEDSLLAVIQTSQEAPGNVPTPDANPVSNDGTNKPLSVTNAQPNDSTEMLPANIVLVTTQAGKEKQAVGVGPATQKTSANIPAPEVNNQDNAAAKKIPVDVTRRSIVSPADDSGAVVITQQEPVASTSADANDANELVRRDDFLYRLQIAASEVRLSEARLKKIYGGANKVHAFKENGMYKYYIMETSNYFVARKKLKEIDADQAFISAYKRDVKLPLQDAIEAQYKVPVIRENLAEVDSVIKIATVNFELDEFELQPDQFERLRSNVINELRRNPSYRAIVNGYTDIRGSEAYNFGLSQERALFVDQRIVAEGIDTGRVNTQYFGESKLAKYCPEHENCDESIHQANRRVEILLLVNKK